jgi:hypothetical protein
MDEIQETSFCLPSNCPDPEVCVLDLINELEGRIRDKIKDYMVSYFSPKLKCYVFVGVVDAGLKPASQGLTAQRLQNQIKGKSAKIEIKPETHEITEGLLITGARSVCNSVEKLSDLVQPDSQEIILKFR